MAQGFADYANKTICNALREHDLLDDPNFTPIEVLGQVETREGSTLEAVQWKVNCVLAWQQIDRRIDECVLSLDFQAADLSDNQLP